MLSKKEWRKGFYQAILKEFNVSRSFLRRTLRFAHGHRKEGLTPEESAWIYLNWIRELRQLDNKKEIDELPQPYRRLFKSLIT